MLCSSIRGELEELFKDDDDVNDHQHCTGKGYEKQETVRRREELASALPVKIDKRSRSESLTSRRTS